MSAEYPAAVVCGVATGKGAPFTSIEVKISEGRRLHSHYASGGNFRFKLWIRFGAEQVSVDQLASTLGLEEGATVKRVSRLTPFPEGIFPLKRAEASGQESRRPTETVSWPGRERSWPLPRSRPPDDFDIESRSYS